MTGYNVVVLKRQTFLFLFLFLFSKIEPFWGNKIEGIEGRIFKS